MFSLYECYILATLWLLVTAVPYLYLWNDNCQCSKNSHLFFSFYIFLTLLFTFCDLITSSNFFYVVLFHSIRLSSLFTSIHINLRKQENTEETLALDICITWTSFQWISKWIPPLPAKSILVFFPPNFHCIRQRGFSWVVLSKIISSCLLPFSISYDLPVGKDEAMSVHKYIYLGTFMDLWTLNKGWVLKPELKKKVQTLIKTKQNKQVDVVPFVYICFCCLCFWYHI